MLHISSDEQKARLMARLDDPTKHWKYKPGDVDERLLWDDYRQAYEIAIERCNTEDAPWHIVPADRKWYRNWAITRLLIEHLDGLGLEWPQPDYDVELERKRLADT
jgi:polyphosphate kinase 2 (PPK2 family)